MLCVAAAAPWPGGTAPAPAALREMISRATERWSADRVFEWDAALQDELDVAIVAVGPGEIGEGFFDLHTSDFYGRQAFQLAWRPDMGLGTAAGTRLSPVHRGDAPGVDATGCEGCHSSGGRDGAGTFAQSALLYGDGDTEASATRRNPPALLGLGLVEVLAAQMSGELQSQRAAARARATTTGAVVSVELSVQGVSFGHLLARPDGSLDLTGIEGVEPDLVVRPFGWKGEFSSLRGFIEEAARVHLGVLSQPLVERTPSGARLGPGGGLDDPDGDGVIRELEEGSLMALAVYLALLETPVIVPPADPGLRARWARGDVLFDGLGCAGCHVRSLKLGAREWRESAESGLGQPLSFNLLAEGDPPRGTDQVFLFSDLKRHDMGPALAEAFSEIPGVGSSEFLTRPLWGLAESAPYLHTGTALTLPEAILAHGGEAARARDEYVAQSEEARQDLTLFLLSLTRQPSVRIAR